MTTVTIEVNGKAVTAEVTPRTHLADFLREQLLLTGTHVGCEHGVCGACTVEIDGEIARSCITFAVACDGATVRTIEGFDDDPLMARLRDAFSTSHALQCGYCTPGQLVAARDLIRRKSIEPDLDIRTEMSGNLCRCTGYAGIVAAIETVAAEQPAVPALARDRWAGPAPGPGAATAAPVKPAAPAAAPKVTAPRPAAPKPAAPKPAAPKPAAPSAPSRPVEVEVGPVTVEAGETRFTQTFVLEHPGDAVWALMRDPEQVAACMPGLALDPPGEDGRLTGRMEVKLGPIAAGFSGEGTMRRDDAARRMAIEGRGSDRRSGSRASGRVDYTLADTTADTGAAATRVDCVIAFTLQGPLAQFGRSDLVRDLVGRIGAAFATNVDVRLRAPDGATVAPAELGGASLLLGVLFGRIRRAVMRMLGRGS
ncbi:2Fe-2S iron-sulfur cluster-binding protein [Rhodoplanes sp. TEM]|uniref:2Fe-2S iron-sulfur cluster-binding protein n=1 Tax=Rhodoplanes tepidamans TaxID=200616 RepID=A0ABT5JGY2_RHOTP|nr:MULTISPECIES: 2Fe-2S iron-sulfur cluster-binding protein [Rhodoplanes]MDC7788753.1 2Fe-2S iron-sulfur cluster-binding protein [Rhodoplanes tepidamans]MDC7983438.1 2Fe-2S iron-sulfur cluster-binding protein [Rhodoplanes sp. TEM]MDQ0354574.1 carbon-monoxide dehydrogenase small subunit [Rhodoplanes tepidamans]